MKHKSKSTRSKSKKACMEVAEQNKEAADSVRIYTLEELDCLLSRNEFDRRKANRLRMNFIGRWLRK